MKRLRIGLAVVAMAAIVALATQAEYANGYREGYKKGWCYGATFCTEPIAPIPPMAPIGRDTFNDGYNDGFLKGKAARQ